MAVPRLPAARWGGWLVLLLVVCAVLDLYRLGGPALFDQDESQYGEIAVEMTHTGDPITLRVNDQPWFVHPPFYMWLVAATSRLLGFSEFTIRLWSVVFSVLAVYATVLLGRDLFNPRVGLLAGAILTVTLQYLFQSRLAVFDTVLMAWMLLAVRAFLRAYRSGRRAEYLQSFLFAGLATVTKGPIGLVLPGLVVSAFVIARRAWGRWREVPWAGGLAVYAAVGLSWYVAETLLHGWAFVATNVGAYTIGRFFGVVEEHSAPVYFYIPVALLGAFPWATFWPAAAAAHLRRWRDHDGSLVVLLGTVIPLLFYSAAQTKLPGYIMPIFPFTAVGVAGLWDAALDRGRDRRIVVGAVWLLVLVGGLFWATAAFLGAQYPGPFRAAGPILAIPGGALVVGAVLVLLLAVRGATLGAFAALCATMAVTWLALLTWAMPLVEDQKPIRPLAAAIVAALSPGDRIVAYRMSTATSLIYYTHHPVVWADREEALRTALCAPGRVFLVITDGERAKLRWTLPALEPVAERAGTRVWLKFASVTCRSAEMERRAPASGRFGGVLAARAGGGPDAPVAPGERAEHAVVVRFPHEVVGALAEHVPPSA